MKTRTMNNNINKTLDGVSKIKNKLDAKMGFIVAETDDHRSIDSANDTEQEYICIY